ncbi:peptidoglycan DD-metalloendopeptidase family protein [Carboxylicivirga mesophila]|uniref:Peptidoglycan DD-metalloendopeptidase family protein n=1 Tax=Carboxylicivirga mesophila TaxID=1166478 RepID=A0ABS5K5J1_9BACT|nr:peptidoglycan DD-metalloendopeptidase family protein [Carboxylicivirga mesophila]MBS2210244.1 peptidoglycan DD-metalloendopeptidase family protein [Carboxylicivirga mesophila]
MTKKKLFIPIIAVLLLIPVVYLLVNRYNHPVSPVTEETLDSLEVIELPEPDLLYGLPVDSFQIEENTVKRNQFLADIFLKAGVDYPTIHTIVEKTKPVFDVRKIKVGNQYHLFFSPDTLKQLRHFVYAIDNTDYMVVSLGDSIHAYRDIKETRKELKVASGVINSSLWVTMTENDINPLLAIELSEIFAWTVDFFGIEKGDNFKVYYNELYVDSVSIGIGEIQAAVFHHRGRDYYAFNYEEDSVKHFFDEEGQSLRKAFLKAPLKFSRISSRFSNSRLHPVLKIRRPHHGIDYAAPTGTPVYALGDGRVIARDYQKRGGGNYIKIKHNSVYTTVYMHLHGFAKGISKGTQVRQGQLIGYVGSTGLSTGPHLDFRVYKNGHPVDPLKIDAPPVNPVKEEHMQDYKSYITPLKLKVDAIPLPVSE